MAIEPPDSNKRKLVPVRPVLPKVATSYAPVRNASVPRTVSPAPRTASPRPGLARSKTETTKSNLSHYTTAPTTPNTLASTTTTPQSLVASSRNDRLYATPTSASSEPVRGRPAPLSAKSRTKITVTPAGLSRTTPNTNPAKQSSALDASQVSNNKTRPVRTQSNESSTGGGSSFVRANDTANMHNLQRPPMASKSSSFVYANGEEEPMQTRSPMALGSPFKERSEESSVLNEPAVTKGETTKQGTTFEQGLSIEMPALSPIFFRAGSPPKDNIHLSYRKGISQIMRPSMPLTHSVTLENAQRLKPDLYRRHSSLDTVSSIRINSVPEARSILHAEPPDVAAKSEVAAGSQSPQARNATHTPCDVGHTASAPSVSTVLSSSSYQSPNESEPYNQSSATSSSADGNALPQQVEAVQARRERKVLDLEISNSSLLAINKSLERELRNQKAELRYLRRVSRTERTTRLSEATTISEYSELSEDGGGAVEREHAGGIPGRGTSESDSRRASGTFDAPSWLALQGQHSESRRMNLSLTKHKDLLMENQKVNQSIRRCLCLVDRLIIEGGKALEYRVRTGESALRAKVTEFDEESSMESDHSHNDQHSGNWERDVEDSLF